MSKKLESELPMDVIEETVGDTDSVSSEESFSVSQSTANFRVPVKLMRKMPIKMLPLQNPAGVKLCQVSVQRISVQ